MDITKEDSLKEVEVKPSVLPIPIKTWLTAILIGLQPLFAGYAITSMNSSLKTGNDNSGAACFNRTGTLQW